LTVGLRSRGQAAAGSAAPEVVRALVLAPAHRAAQLAGALEKNPVVGPAAVHTVTEGPEALTRALVAGRWDVVLVDASDDGPPPGDIVAAVGIHDPALPVIVTGVKGKREAARLRAAGARSALSASLARLGAVVAREITATRVLRNLARALAVEDRLAWERRQGRAVAAARKAERHRVGRELHDEMGQILTAIRLEAATLARQPESTLAAARLAAEIGQSAGDLLHMLQGRLDELVPAPLWRHGLVPALRRRVAAWERETGVPCEVSVDGPMDDLDGPTRLTAYRVVQEALTNAARHARCSRVLVQVKRRPGTRGGNDLLEASVTDDGIGVSETDPAGSGGARGLDGLRERVAAVEGKLTVTGGPGKGTCVAARLSIVPLSRGVQVAQSGA